MYMRNDNLQYKAIYDCWGVCVIYVCILVCVSSIGRVQMQARSLKTWSSELELGLKGQVKIWKEGRKLIPTGG